MLSVICGDGNCSRRATVRLGIDTLIANILVQHTFQYATAIGSTAAEHVYSFFGRPFVCFCYLSVLPLTLVYCGQTAGWIKMKLGTEVGLGPAMLDGNPAPLPKGAHPPNFRPMSVMAKRLDVLDWGPALPKVAQPPILGPYLLWPKRSPISATADSTGYKHNTSRRISANDVGVLIS